MNVPPDILKRIEAALADGTATEGPRKPAHLAVGTSPPVPIGWEEEGLSEAQFQQRVINLAHAHGWVCAHFRKVRVQRENGRTYWETPVAADGKGFPDLILAREGQVIVAELKVGKNTTTPEQEVWLSLFRTAFLPTFVWRPVDWPEIVKTLGG